MIEPRILPPARRQSNTRRDGRLRPVKIAVDSRALLAERTGIGTYTYAIARALAERNGAEIGLFAPRPFPKTLPRTGPFSLHTDHHPFGILWLQTTLPGRLERWGADVLLSALTIGPARGITPFVSVVHDLTPITHPEWHARRTLVGFVPMWDHTVERAARFLCVSETTAQDLVARYPETARARARRAQRRGPRFLLAGRRPGGAPAHAPALRGRAPVRPVPGHARAAQERRDARRRLRAALGPPALAARPRARRRARLEDRGPSPAHRPLAVPGQDPPHGLRAARGRARALPGGRGLRLPLARGGLRSAGARGHGLRHAGRLVGRPTLSSRSAATRRCGRRPATSRRSRDRSSAPSRTTTPRETRGGGARPRREVSLGGRGAGDRRRASPRPPRRPPVSRAAAAPHRHRRAQAEGLRHRLLHPQPDRVDRAAPGGRAVPSSASTCPARTAAPCPSFPTISRSSTRIRPATRSPSSRASPGD